VKYYFKKTVDDELTSFLYQNIILKNITT
jgi:hypothetical protein